MQGDFSNIIRNEYYDALLVQQGRPLLDSQINGISMALLEGRENAISELLSLKGRVVLVPDVNRAHNVGARDSLPSIGIQQLTDLIGKVRSDPSSSPDYVYVDGIRARINYTHVPAKNNGFFHIDVYEEILATVPGISTPFEDRGIIGSDSLRMRRIAVWQVSDSFNDWPANIDGDLTFHPFDQLLQNGLYRFSIAIEDRMTRLLFSKNNAGFVIPIDFEKLESANGPGQKPGQKIVLKFMQNATDKLRIGQVVEFAGHLFNPPTQGSKRFLATIEQIDGNTITVDKMPAGDGFQMGTEVGKADQIRVWDQVRSLVRDEEAPRLHANFDGFSVSLPLTAESPGYESGQYWVVPIRQGRQVEGPFQRHSPIIRRVLIGAKAQGASNGSDAGVFEVANMVVEPGERQLNASLSDGLAETPNHEVTEIWAAIQASNLLQEPKTLAVSRWLASTKLDEIVDLNKGQLQARIQRDCNAKEYDEASLEEDLNNIIARRDELLLHSRLA